LRDAARLVYHQTMPADRPSSEPAAQAPATTPPEDDGVDISLIRWMLSLTPMERLGVLEDAVNDLIELRDAGQKD
jgi:hypothetical protein